MNYLFDTNAVIYLLKGETKIPDPAAADQLYISFISKIELLAYPHQKVECQRIEQFLSSVSIMYIDDSLIEIAVKIRMQHNLQLPDAIIVASAITKDAVLLTADQRIIKKASAMGVAVLDPLSGK